MSLLHRKHSYRANIYKGDYFVLKHLNEFITNGLSNYIKKGDIVGDIGCGEQPMRTFITDLGGEYISVDLQQNSSNNVKVEANITNIPLANDYFDLILCTEVLEHVPDIFLALQELARLIRPNGVILITIPFVYPLHEEPFDFTRVTPHLIKVLSDKLNLQILQLTTTGNDFEVIATILDNFWSQTFKILPGFLRRFCSLVMRIPINIIAYLGSIIAVKLPKSIYLNTVCILSKR
jgi:ubiquinone/menaquinone biosynthesis C-methylase UbiE